MITLYKQPLKFVKLDPRAVNYRQDLLCQLKWPLTNFIYYFEGYCLFYRQDFLKIEDTSYAPNASLTSASLAFEFQHPMIQFFLQYY